MAKRGSLREFQAHLAKRLAGASDLADIYIRANLKDGEGIYFGDKGQVLVDSPRFVKAFELAKAGFTLLAERYPDNLRFADVSRSGQQSMMDLQLFAEGEAAREQAAASGKPIARRMLVRY